MVDKEIMEEFYRDVMSAADIAHNKNACEGVFIVSRKF